MSSRLHALGQGLSGIIERWWWAVYITHCSLIVKGGGAKQSGLGLHADNFPLRYVAKIWWDRSLHVCAFMHKICCDAGCVCQGIDSQLQKTLLHVCIPVVFNLVVSPSGQMSCYGRPSAWQDRKQKRWDSVLESLSHTVKAAVCACDALEWDRANLFPSTEWRWTIVWSSASENRPRLISGRK